MCISPIQFMSKQIKHLQVFGEKVLKYLSCFIFFPPLFAQASEHSLSGNTGLSFNSPSAYLSLGYSKKMSEGNFLSKIEWNPWISLQDLNGLWNTGVLNIGMGWEKQYFDSRCRSAVILGSTTLLFDTALDPVGSTGVFIELSPVSLRFPIDKFLTLRVDPADIQISAPVLSGIPLITMQYRHGIALEWSP